MTIFNNTTSSGSVQPGDTLVARIQNRRGYKVNLPQPLAPGELGWCIDTKELFIGLDDITSSSLINVKTQIDVQALLDTNIIEFSTKWSNLNFTANTDDISGIIVPDESEAKLMNDLKNMTSNDFLLKNPLIADIHSKVGILRHCRDAIDNAFQSYYPAWQPIMSTIAIVEKTPAVQARVIVTGVTGGVVDDVALDLLVETDAGLGYVNGSTIYVENPLGGVPAEVIITTSDDGEGRIETVTLVNGGSGYPAQVGNVKYAVSAPDYSAYQATATCTLSAGGKVGAVNITSIGDNYRTKPTVLVSGGSPTVKAELEVTGWTPLGGITEITVVSGGSGYVTPPIIIIAPPLETDFYRLIYQIGVPSIDTPAKVATYVDIMNSLNAAVDVYYPPSTLFDPDHNAQLLGLGGYGFTVVVDGNDDASLQMETPNQAGSTSAMINAINPQDPPLALTSQNVEILTSYSEMPPPPTSIIYPTSQLYTGTLPATQLSPVVVWANVEVTGPSNPIATPLAFDPSETDFQHLTVSVKYPGSLYLMGGNMIIITANGLADLTLDSTEVKHGLATNYIYFKAVVVLGITYVQYAHNFPQPLTIKFISSQWLA